MRALLFILALVVALLAVLLDQPLLYVVALALALAVVAVLLYTRQRRRKAEMERLRASAAPGGEQDELRSLGLSEVRARPRDEAPKERGDLPDPSPAPRAEVGARPEEHPASRAPRHLGYIALETDDPARRDAVLGHTLHAALAAIDAHTICLLHQHAGGRRCTVEASVSRNAYIRNHGYFSIREPLLPASGAAGFTLRAVGNDGIPAGDIGYYREPIAVRQAAIVPVRSARHERFFLMADTTVEGGLDRPEVRPVLESFARTVGVLMDAPEEATVVAEDDVEDAPDERPRVRPRREIIEEEMARAREEGAPLALALVHLNRAEAVAEQGDDAVAEAERALRARLEAYTDVRIERFGELTFGVFSRQEPAELERRALDFERSLADADGLLAGGVSIGIALLADRHTDADGFRADATAALHEAYDSGQAVILE